MSFIKRIFLFLLTNLAVIVLIWIVLAILQSVFGFKLTTSWNYTWLFIYALIFWFAGSIISLFLSKWTAKRAYNIKLFDPQDLSDLSDKEKVVYEVVRELAEKNKIKMPEVWIYQSQDPNAFATWATKNSSLVAVSSGLLKTMDKNAIEWVIWHEMAHVLNGDMVTMVLLQGVLNTFVIFLARFVAWLFDRSEWEWPWPMYFIISTVLDLLLWILASLVVMWFSRHREFRADEWSAKFVWKEKMIAWLEALKKLVDSNSWNDEPKLATMKISASSKKWFKSLFSTHPDLGDRIEKLKNLKID